MEAKLHLFAVLAAAMLHATNCAGQSNVVYYGTNASPISVAFADTNLSASVKEAIVADLSICFQGWATNAEIIVREKK